MIRLLLILFFLLICKFAYSDVYVIYNPQTKEVASIQDDDSAVLQPGMTKKVIAGKTISDYQLEHKALDYKFIDNKFIVNTQKLTEEENERALSVEVAKEQKMIADKMRDIAIDQLRAEGKTIKYTKKTGE